jgi:aryl-alcohol dehydrogenase-like predicted oxidoreductase
VQNEYSLLHPSAGKNVFAYCRANGISFMGYGTLCGGFLSGKYKREPNLRRADARNYFYKTARGTAFTQAQLAAARVQQVAQAKGVCAAAVAGAWALQKAGFILCGAKTPAQVAQNAAAADVTLTAEETAFLEQVHAS